MNTRRVAIELGVAEELTHRAADPLIEGCRRVVVEVDHGAGL